MNEINSQSESRSESFVSIARAIRFGFASIVIGLSYPSIRCAHHIHDFNQIYRDMLGNKPLPAATAFIVHAQPFFIASSILFPLVAVALIFTPRLIMSLYVSGVLVLATFVQLFFQWHALTGPLFTIIQSMGGVIQEAPTQ